MIKELHDPPEDPKDANIQSLSNARLVPHLMALKAIEINTLRNRIVHKQAYRPTRERAESALKDTENILFSLQGHLQLHDDINWYMTPGSGD